MSFNRVYYFHFGKTWNIPLKKNNFPDWITATGVGIPVDLTPQYEQLGKRPQVSWKWSSKPRSEQRNNKNQKKTLNWSLISFFFSLWHQVISSSLLFQNRLYCGSVILDNIYKREEEKTGQTPFIPIHCLWQHSPFPGGSDGKASACDAGDRDLIPGSRRSPGEGNGNPLQYSCLENPMDGGGWWATVHGVAKSWTRLSNFTGSLMV